MNLFKLVIIPRELQEEDEEEEKEKEEEVEELSSNMHLIWDAIELDDIDDDIMEEACVGNGYNIQSKGVPTINDFPSTSKMGLVEKNKDVRRNSTTAQPTTIMDLTQMILGDLKLDYDVVEYFKKMKVNITVFEL